MYDHSHNIGNKGDLIKHFALTLATREMATGRESFSYLDVHSGRSDYDLSASSDWKKGIGKFAEYCRQDKPRTYELLYFCDVQSIAAVFRTRNYPGSSRIVFNVLEDLGVSRIKAILCDTNPAVCSDLESQYKDARSVEICCTDGYQKAHEVDSVDLVFIDPPDIEEHYQPFVKVIRHCISKRKPFVSWNPLCGTGPRQTISHNCLSVTELAEKERISSVTVRWTKDWTGKMCGCQMLFFVPQGNKVAAACDALIDLMDWNRIHS